MLRDQLLGLLEQDDTLHQAQANEERRFPVVFVVDPKLPETVNTITLSYAFFGVGTGMQPQAAPAPGLMPPQARMVSGS